MPPRDVSGKKRRMNLRYNRSVFQYGSIFDLLESHITFLMILPVCLKIKTIKK
jgi:hypothetical protein